MKSLGELMFNLKEDPEKERHREKTLAAARAWEEADPRRPPPPALSHVGGGDDRLAERLRAALPMLDASQRRMLETLLDSWGM